MKTNLKTSAPSKIAEMPQILTKNLKMGLTLCRGNFKRIKVAFPRPFPETSVIKVFLKIGFKALKGHLKGVLNTLKGVLKEMVNLTQKHQMSQPPILIFLNLAAKNAKDHEVKKEVIWNQ